MKQENIKQEQFINAVILSLNVDYLNLEDEITNVINSGILLKEKVEKTKKLIAKLVTVENNINKFKALFIGNEGAVQEVAPEVNQVENGKV